MMTLLPCGIETQITRGTSWKQFKIVSSFEWKNLCFFSKKHVLVIQSDVHIRLIIFKQYALLSHDKSRSL